MTMGWGSTAKVEVRPGPAPAEPNQRVRGQWHVQHLLSSYSPWFYLLLQIRAFLKRRRNYAGNMALRARGRGRAMPAMWRSSQCLLPNLRDEVNWINSFNKDGVKCILSSPGTRANYWQTRRSPSAKPACSSPVCAEDAVLGIYCGSAKSRAGGRTSIFLREGCWATGKLSAGRWRLCAHTHLLHHLRLTWFWWINIRWKSTVLLSLSPPNTQGSLR